MLIGAYRYYIQNVMDKFPKGFFRKWVNAILGGPISPSVLMDVEGELSRIMG